MIELGDLLERLHVVSLPLHTRFRGVTFRECALIEGTHGWGEFAPFVEYPPEEARAWLDAALEAAFTSAPPRKRDEIEVNATVPAVAAADVPSVLDRYDGCTTVKVKVAERGQTLNDDVERIDAVRERLGSDVAIRVDANGAWSLPEAIAAIETLVSRGPLEYVEQPCATIKELAQIRRHFGGDVLIAADESIRKSEDPYRVRDAEAADVAVIKVAPLGGVARALAIAAEIDLPVVVSSELTSSIGIAVASTLAGALPELPFACGLATADLLAADVVDVPLAPRHGRIPVGRLVPDLGLLEEHRASVGRQEWWRERVTACWTR